MFSLVKLHQCWLYSLVHLRNYKMCYDELLVLLCNTTLDCCRSAPLGGLYDVSYVWLGGISTGCSVILGMLISVLANACGE